MTSYPKLTCCGGNPRSCQYLYNVSSCPKGSYPKFCCGVSGQISPAEISKDSSGDILAVCPTRGDIPYNSYSPDACQQYPVTNCCDEGECYQSKSSLCNNYGVWPPGDAGDPVTDCSTCKYAKLTCCGGYPRACQYLSNVSSCPKGLTPEFCCGVSGKLSPATISKDPSSGQILPVCPKLGDIPYDSYHSVACQQLTPVTNCCDEGECYQSKSPMCQFFGGWPPTDAGDPVPDCSTCKPQTSNPFCCFPGQSCQQRQDGYSFCYAGSYQVPDCSFCPGTGTK